MVLGSEMPSETRETDIPLGYKARWGGDELRDLEDAAMKRNGKQSKGERRGGERGEERRGEEEQVTEKTAGTEVTGEVICGCERGAGREGG